MTERDWFYVETTDADNRRVPAVVKAESRTVAIRLTQMDHRRLHPSAGWVEVTACHVIDRDKANDIRRYMDAGDWHGWPLGVRVMT